MRNEREMLDLILDTARGDGRIRAVVMNGSRANPGAPRDFFQDFDVVYLVTDVASFTADHGWIDRFGERMILQTPEAMGEAPSGNGGRFVYLMQFMDGNRIDLTLFPLARMADLAEDSQSILLLDKDGIVGPLPPPSDGDYLPKPPTEKRFAECCNEFFWVGPYVAKGLWRREIPYAKHMLDHFVREKLMEMLSWHVGVKTGFSKSPGKLGKYLDRYLEPELWEMLLSTYSDADPENTWNALFTACDLFRTLARPMAERFGFDYPRGDDERVCAHLRHVRSLPRDATAMY